MNAEMNEREKRLEEAREYMRACNAILRKAQLMRDHAQRVFVTLENEFRAAPERVNEGEGKQA